MKFILLFAIIIISCGKSKNDDSPRIPQQWEVEGLKFEKNYFDWQKIKEKYSSYSYYFLATKNINDPADDNLKRINVAVKEGEIVCRSMIDVKTKSTIWEEKFFINSHKDVPRGITIDDVYRKCTALYLLDKTKIVFFYYTSKDGELILEGCNRGNHGSYTLDDVPIHDFDLSKFDCA